MGYVAVRGGGRAIEESLALLEFERVMASEEVGTDAIRGLFPELIDQVMGEASLFSPRLAALALKQAQGSPDEAVFLLRAFRSTLERPFVSRPLDMGHMQVRRRISAAFKDVPGGQVLGSTRDYSHRLLDFALEVEDAGDLAAKRAALARHFDGTGEDAARVSKEGAGKGFPEPSAPAVDSQGIADFAASVSRGERSSTDVFPEPSAPLSEGFPESPPPFPRVLDYLRAEGLVASCIPQDGNPVDATMAPLTFPAARSVRLQTLARGMTQAVEALGYAAIRGFGPSHPTVGELRAGKAAVAIDHPLEVGDADDAYYLGSIPVTEVESVFPVEASDSDDTGMAFDIGYGLVVGRAESKAIAMSVLDHCLEHGDARFPTEDEEFVLYHVDGVEATGFISHLKLPHYVTFQSKLSSVRGSVEMAGEESRARDEGGMEAACEPSSDGGAHADDGNPVGSEEEFDGAAL